MFAPDLVNMTQAVAMTDYRVRFQFDTESFWHLHAVSYKPIIPKHIFMYFNKSEWYDWSPTPGDRLFVTSGPFVIESYFPEEFITFSCNSYYFFRPAEIISSTSDDATDMSGIDLALSLTGGIMATSIVLLAGAIVLIRKS